MIVLNARETLCLKGGSLFPECTPLPEPPPNGIQWLPPNPDTPTASAPTTPSPH
jgi:hypothetical protein